MTNRLRLVSLGALLAARSLSAQAPPQPQPQLPTTIVIPARGGLPIHSPMAPRQVPPLQVPPGYTPAQQSDDRLPKPDASARLPKAEKITRVDYRTATVRRLGASWQLWVGGKAFRDFGNDADAADEALRAVRDLRPTEWGMIGGDRPVLEYGLTNGKPAPWVPTPKWSLPVDLQTVRAENVRGAWVLKDDENILLNFGPDQRDAEQAAAVAKKYGFNRIGLIGFPAPLMAYYFAAPVQARNQKGADPAASLVRAAQEQSLTRTGIPVPGVGFVGERILIDPRKVEVRRERGEYVLAHGSDVLARFGSSQWAATDALKAVQECRFTEFCRFGSAGVTFFLVNGAAPTRVPFSVQGTSFDPEKVAARATSGRWGVFESGGRMLYPAATKEEAEQLVRIIKGYQFDQLCRVGLSPRASLKFLAKTGR
jgi:hypothetical protein